jgi:hypothetical protein
MKLWEIPRDSKMKIKFEDGVKDCTFHHVDGMYSYCTVDEAADRGTFHLSASTPMKLIDNYYVVGEEDEQ